MAEQNTTNTDDKKIAPATAEGIQAVTDALADLAKDKKPSAKKMAAPLTTEEKAAQAPLPGPGDAEVQPQDDRAADAQESGSAGIPDEPLLNFDEEYLQNVEQAPNDPLAGVPEVRGITTARFLATIFSDMGDDSRVLRTQFDGPAKEAPHSVWYGQPTIPRNVKDIPAENTYYCPSEIGKTEWVSKKTNKPVSGFRRWLNGFVALRCIVLDDIKNAVLAKLPPPTYVIETSAENYQVGYKLAESVTDKVLARTLHNAIHKLGYCDSNGNNPVRWVRLPVGRNVGKQFDHKLRIWAPDTTYTVDSLVERLGLDLSEAKADPKHKAERASGAHAGASGSDFEEQVATEQQVADLRTMIADARKQGLHRSKAGHNQLWSDLAFNLCLLDCGEELFIEFSEGDAEFDEQVCLNKLQEKRDAIAQGTPPGSIVGAIARLMEQGIENPAKGRRQSASDAFEDFADDLAGAQADDRAPKQNAGEVIANLLAMGAEAAKLVWVKMVLPMNRIDTTEVLRALNTRYGWGLRDMNGELADEKGRIAAEAAVASAEAQLNGRAVVAMNATQTARMAKKAEVALLKVVKLHDYCLFGDNLSCVNVRAIPGMHAIDRPDLAPPPVVSIAPLVDAEIVAKLERTVAFCTLNPQGRPSVVHPVPRPVVEQLRSSLREFGPRTVPIITGVATRPMVLADGTILNTEGLDPRTGLFLYKTAVMPITAFTKAEAEQALNELRKGDFSAGFDFGTRLDRDTAIATLFTGVQRRLLAEAPGTLINATVQSSGKTTLARRIHLIVTGRDMPVSGVPREEVEMKKSVEALLRYNPEMVCFDNIPDGHTFRSETLARVMTSSEMSARILGVSENMVLPTNVLWLLTGNNVGLGNDELTRFMRVNLSPNSFNPETRVFARPDVVAHAREIRERVLQLALGIIAGFLVSGDTTTPKSRFHDWDRLVRQPLIWCGGEDVATCFEENAGRSEAKAALSDLIEALIVQYEDEDKQVRFTLSQLANDLLRVKEAKPDFFQPLFVINESLVALRAKEVTSVGSLGHAFSSVEGQLVRLNDGTGAKLIRKKSPGLGRHWEVERGDVRA